MAPSPVAWIHYCFYLSSISKQSGSKFEVIFLVAKNVFVTPQFDNGSTWKFFGTLPLGLFIFNFMFFSERCWNFYSRFLLFVEYVFFYILALELPEKIDPKKTTVICRYMTEIESGQ